MYQNPTNYPPRQGGYCMSQSTTLTRGTRRPLNLTPEMLDTIRQNARFKIPELPPSTGFGRRRKNSATPNQQRP